MALSHLDISIIVGYLAFITLVSLEESFGVGGGLFPGRPKRALVTVGHLGDGHVHRHWGSARTALRYGPQVNNYNDPEGWQAICRHGKKGERILVVAHRFRDDTSTVSDPLQQAEDHDKITDLRRELDLRTSVVRMQYTCGGVRFTREAFVSAIDQVLVVRITADKPATDYGISIDQELAHEVFRNSLTTARVLGIDNEFTREVSTVLPKLALPRTGNDGRLLEWRAPREEAEPRHRHFAHLYGFHPGNRILLDDTPDQVRAVRKSLLGRLNPGGRGTDEAPGTGGTVWQRGWLLSIWLGTHARTGDF